MATTLTLAELCGPIESELQDTKGVVTEQWASVLALVDGSSEFRPEVGGKLLRPMLTLLSAGAVGADPHRFVRMAAAMELLHIGALAHDDVVDGAALRRGTSSLNAHWNDRAAILGGDFLVARAIALIAGYHSTDVVGEVARCVEVMAEGELRDLGSGATQCQQERCIRLARSKTAELFATACALPARLAGKAHAEPLRRFGLDLGVGFQLVDDLLDLVQDEETLGKPSCGDLAAGKTTLPILLMRESLSESELARLDGFRGNDLTADDRTWVLARIEETGARRRTEQTAQDYIAQARAHLSSLPPTPYRESMEGIAEFVLMRGC